MQKHAIRRATCLATSTRSAFARSVQAQGPCHVQRMDMSILRTPPPFVNEPVKHYAKSSPEREAITQALYAMKDKLPITIPVTANGIKINKDYSNKQLNPSKHTEAVAHYAAATPDDIQTVVDAALKAKPAWEALPFEERAAVFLRAAELIAGKYRYEIMAATMLGQGKNIWQAEIDAAAETCDFFRQYVHEAYRLFAEQPGVQLQGNLNKLEYRPLEGFVYAIAPFNFTALGATLIGPAALLGNVVIWKPSPSALSSAYLLHEILLEAGLPKDVIQLLPGDAELITSTLLSRPEFAGLSYIGSTSVFKSLLGKIGEATAKGTFRTYPRVVGETGGKNFHIVHGSADVTSAAKNTIRAAFEYQGQKCSALSRAYVAESAWPDFQRVLTEETAKLKVGPPEDFSNFINPVIHEAAFDRVSTAIEAGKADPELELVLGGQCDKSTGYYIHPTVFKTKNPHHDFMQRELFGPVLTVYVFPDSDWPSIPRLVDATSTYALTGSIFARDPTVLELAKKQLMHAAGMLYINTKCTGSVVGQQPFGGSRDSGTNDKTGTAAHLLRFTSVRTVKEEFGGLEEVAYPSNEV